MAAYTEIRYSFNLWFRPTKIYVCLRSQVKKIYGRSVGIIFFLTIGKTGNSRARFRNPIPVFHFRNFRHLLYDELHSFSTFFALNFDKKLAVE